MESQQQQDLRGKPKKAVALTDESYIAARAARAALPKDATAQERYDAVFKAVTDAAKPIIEQIRAAEVQLFERMLALTEAKAA